MIGQGFAHAETRPEDETAMVHEATGRPHHRADRRGRGLAQATQQFEEPSLVADLEIAVEVTEEVALRRRGHAVHRAGGRPRPRPVRREGALAEDEEFAADPIEGRAQGLETGGEPIAIAAGRDEEAHRAPRGLPLDPDRRENSPVAGPDPRRDRASLEMGRRRLRQAARRRREIERGQRRRDPRQMEHGPAGADRIIDLCEGEAIEVASARVQGGDGPLAGQGEEPRAVALLQPALVIEARPGEDRFRTGAPIRASP